MSSLTAIKQFFQSAFDLTGNSEKNSDQVKYQHLPGKQNEDVLDSPVIVCSIDDILDDIGLRWFHIKLCVLLGLLNMADSLEVSTLSLILPTLKLKWKLTSAKAAVLTFSLPGGMILGSSFWGWISDKYGRKKGFIGSATFVVLSAFASVFSHDYYSLWVTLFCVGFGVASISLIYVLTMEIFPPKFRAMLAILNTASWTLGFLLSAIASMELPVIGYRGALSIVCFPTFIFLIGTIFLPETPHYHLAAGSEDKALDLLQEFAPEMNLRNIELIQITEPVNRADLTQLFRHGYWKITFPAFVMSFTIFTAYYNFVYAASNIASHANTAKLVQHEVGRVLNSNLYRTMALMNLPELGCVFAVAIVLYIWPAAKRVLLVLLATTITLLIIAVIIYFLGQREALLILTLISRSLTMISTVFVYIVNSLLYPGENRNLGVGANASVGRLGMLLGPFLFEAFFVKASIRGFVFNIAILLLALITTSLLPSRSVYLG